MDILTDVFKLMKSLLGTIFFLKFFEQRDMFRSFIQKKVQGKNKVTRNLSSCVVENFNGYEMIKRDLAHKGNIELTPINIVYEPSYDEKIPVPYFFNNQIYMSCRS